MKPLFLSVFLLFSIFTANLRAQLPTNLLDNFNRANSDVIGNTPTLPTSLTWSETQSGATGVQIFSNQLRLGLNTQGRDIGYVDISGVTGYPVTLNTAGGIMTWAFNMRQNRNNLSGFDNNNWGVGFILGKSTTPVGTGNGYAVIIGNQPNSDRVKIAKFTGGIDADAKFTPVVTGNLAFGHDYYFSVKVTYNPTGDLWSLYIDTSSTGFPQTDPRNTATLNGTGSDNTYTGVPLPYIQCLWNHGNSPSTYAFFDDIYVTDPNGALPVELISFTASVNNRNVGLYWATASELNNRGFDIERREMKGTEASNWVKAGFVEGHGTTNTVRQYSFMDAYLNTGKYQYRLKQIDYNGNYEYFNLNDQMTVGSPGKFNVSQNYPNPSNPSTKIDYQIPFGAKVTVRLFDVQGKLADVKSEGYKDAGYYTVEFNGSNLSSGVYFYVITAEGESQHLSKTMKMILVK